MIMMSLPVLCRRLEVQLPRFILEQSYSLQKVLPGLGISEVFQDSADFSGIGGETGLRLSEVSVSWCFSISVCVYLALSVHICVLFISVYVFLPNVRVCGCVSISASTTVCLYVT